MVGHRQEGMNFQRRTIFEANRFMVGASTASYHQCLYAVLAMLARYGRRDLP